MEDIGEIITRRIEYAKEIRKECKEEDYILAEQYWAGAQKQLELVFELLPESLKEF